MLKSKKSENIIELEEICNSSSSIIVTHYHGLTVSEITRLRKNLREQGAHLKVVKNTLVKIAASKANIPFKDLFAGPTAIAYSADPVSAAKVVVDFAKTKENLKIIGGVVNSEFLDAKGVGVLATLPSMEQIRANIVGVLQAPAAKLLAILNEPGRRVAAVLKSYSDKQ